VLVDAWVLDVSGLGFPACGVETGAGVSVAVEEDGAGAVVVAGEVVGLGDCGTGVPELGRPVDGVEVGDDVAVGGEEVGVDVTGVGACVVVVEGGVVVVGVGLGLGVCVVPEVRTVNTKPCPLLSTAAQDSVGEQETEFRFPSKSSRVG
jgi:hypothetical protein